MVTCKDVIGGFSLAALEVGQNSDITYIEILRMLRNGTSQFFYLINSKIYLVFISDASQ